MTREEQRDTACTNWICSQENGTVIKAREVWKAAVEWADSHPAWVSVEERLPEENTAPLVRMDLTDKFGEETILYDVVVFDGNGFHTPYKVTHWMQITPPVKKGGQNDSNDK